MWEMCVMVRTSKAADSGPRADAETIQKGTIYLTIQSGCAILLTQSGKESTDGDQSPEARNHEPL